LSRGADVHAARDFCIRNAAKLGLYDICTILLQAGADPFANESEAIAHAVTQNDDKLLKLFLQFGDIGHGLNATNIVARTEELDSEIARLQGLQVEE
jgi:hypothetical protein